MFTHLVTQILTLMGDMPALVVYLVVAVWIGLDNAGIPLPMEPVLLFTGALAATGHTVILLGVGSAVVGALAFASLAYYLGRRFGKEAIMRVGRHVRLTPARAAHIELWLRQRGLLGVLLASLCPILRTFSAYIMGGAGVTRRMFVLGTLAGALVYSSLWIVLGSVLGNNYRAPLRYLDSLGLAGVAILATAATVALALHHFWGRLALRHVSLHFHRHQASLAAVALAVDDGGSPAMRAAFALAHHEANGWGAARGLSALSERARQLTQDERRPGTSAAFAAPWPDWVGAVITCVLAEIGAALLLLAFAAHAVVAFPMDPGLAAWVQQIRGTPLASVVNLAGDLQWYLPTSIAYVLIYGTLLALRRYRAALCTAAAGFGTDIFNVAVNTFVGRPRPYGVRIPTLTANLGQGSFPSGHVAHAVGLYGFVFFLCVLGMRASPRWKPWLLVVQAICAYFIVFVGLSRVLEGDHWPSDVLGGYLSGTLTLSLAIVLYHVLSVRAERRHRAAVETEVLAAVH